MMYLVILGLTERFRPVADLDQAEGLCGTRRDADLSRVAAVIERVEKVEFEAFHDVEEVEVRLVPENRSQKRSVNRSRFWSADRLPELSLAADVPAWVGRKDDLSRVTRAVGNQCNRHPADQKGDEEEQPEDVRTGPPVEWSAKGGIIMERLACNADFHHYKNLVL